MAIPPAPPRRICFWSPAGLVLLWALSATLCNLPSTAAAADAPASAIRVLCYNIHYGQGTDGQYDIERLAKVIQAAKPDLVALQEVDVGVRRSGQIHQAQQLGQLMGMSVWFGPTQHFEGGLFGNAVLTRFPVESVLIQPLPYTESSPERTTYPRGAVAVMLKLPDESKLRFISTHFQHNVPEDRVAEATAINELFAHDDNDVPTILAGDMNAQPNEEPIEILLQRWTHTMDSNATPTAPSIKPRSRIDYIFHRGNGRLRLKSSQVISEEIASDHRPVLVEFELLDGTKR